jgi:Ring finger domain
MNAVAQDRIRGESDSEKENLDAAEIEKYLPLVDTSHFCEATDEVQEIDQCMICLEKHLKGQEVRLILLCGHKFHSNCLLEWINLKYSCPNCKQDFSRQSLIEYERAKNPIPDGQKNGLGVMPQDYVAPMPGKPMFPIQRSGVSRQTGPLTRVVLNRRQISRTVIPGRRQHRLVTGGGSNLNSSTALPTSAEIAYLRPAGNQQPSMRGLLPLTGPQPGSLNQIPTNPSSQTRIGPLLQARPQQARPLQATSSWTSVALGPPVSSGRLPEQY